MISSGVRIFGNVSFEISNVWTFGMVASAVVCHAAFFRRRVPWTTVRSAMYLSISDTGNLSLPPSRTTVSTL